MDIAIFTPAEIPVVFRALRTAVAGSAPLDAAARDFLAACCEFAPIDLAPDDIQPVDPSIVADRLTRPHARRRLVQLAAAGALLRVPVTREAAAFVHGLADALSAPDPVVRVLDALSRGRRMRACLLTRKRVFGIVLRETWASDGMPGLLRFFGAMFLRVAVDKAHLWSFKKLGLLPDGTLGREFWRHTTESGFGFPGEKGGIPSTVVYHDVGHVLTGYDTTPRGEIQQAAFQAGNRRDDGFGFLQFALLQFHQGIRVTPIAPPVQGCFDPHRVLRAIARGARCNVDITHGWNFWPLLPLPIADVRQRLAITPAEARS